MRATPHKADVPPKEAEITGIQSFFKAKDVRKESSVLMSETNETPLPSALFQEKRNSSVQEDESDDAEHVYEPPAKRQRVID